MSTQLSLRHAGKPLAWFHGVRFAVPRWSGLDCGSGFGLAAPAQPEALAAAPPESSRGHQSGSTLIAFDRRGGEWFRSFRRTPDAEPKKLLHGQPAVAELRDAAGCRHDRQAG